MYCILRYLQSSSTVSHHPVPYSKQTPVDLIDADDDHLLLLKCLDSCFPGRTILPHQPTNCPTYLLAAIIINDYDLVEDGITDFLCYHFLYR